MRLSNGLQFTLFILLFVFTNTKLHAGALGFEFVASTAPQDFYLSVEGTGSPATLELQQMVRDIRLNSPSTPLTPAQFNDLISKLEASVNELAAADNSFISNDPSIQSLLFVDGVRTGSGGNLEVAKIMSKVLLEPDFVMHFKGLLEEKSFFENFPPPGPPLPDETRVVELASPIAAGAHCDPNMNQCSIGLQCAQFPEPDGEGCFELNNTCSSNNECCSGMCSGNVCMENNQCTERMPPGVAFTDGSLQCLTAAENGDIALERRSYQGEDGTSYFLCVEALPELPDEAIGSITFNPNSCAMVFEERTLERFDQNERMLLAFEFVFSNTSTNDHYGHLEKIKTAARAYQESRISTKRSYEQQLNSIFADFDNIQSRTPGSEGDDPTAAQSGADEAVFYDFFIREQNAILAREVSRSSAYNSVLPSLDAVSEAIRGFNWGKKKWFKKNKCGKWSIPLLRGKNHRKCAKNKWQVNSASRQNSNLRSANIEGSNNNLPGKCVMDPGAPNNLRPNGCTSIGCLVNKYSRALKTYADTPIGNGSGSSSLQIPDKQISYTEENINGMMRRKISRDQGTQDEVTQTTTESDVNYEEQVDILRDLEIVVAKTVSYYGSGSSCRNPAQSKFAYIAQMKNAIREIQDFYREASEVRRDRVIPCLEARKERLLNPDCVIGLPVDAGGCDNTVDAGADLELVDGEIADVTEITCENPEDCPEPPPGQFDDNQGDLVNTGDVLGFDSLGGSSATTTTGSGNNSNTNVTSSDTGVTEAALSAGAPGGQGAFNTDGIKSGSALDNKSKGGFDLNGADSGFSLDSSGSSGLAGSGGASTGAGIGGSGGAAGSRGFGLGANGGEAANGEDSNQTNKDAATEEDKNAGGFISLGEVTKRRRGKNKIYDPFGDEVSEDEFDSNGVGALGGSFGSGSKDADMINRAASSSKNKGLEADNIFTRVSKTYKREALPIFLIRPEDKTKDANKELEFERTPASKDVFRKEEKDDLWKDF